VARFGASPLFVRNNYSQHTKRGGASKRRIRTRELTEERERTKAERERERAGGALAAAADLDRPVRIVGGESSRPSTCADSVPVAALLILLTVDFFIWVLFWGAV
jgi:hypothetical protein